MTHHDNVDALQEIYAQVYQLCYMGFFWKLDISPFFLTRLFDLFNVYLIDINIFFIILYQFIFPNLLSK